MGTIHRHLPCEELVFSLNVQFLFKIKVTMGTILNRINLKLKNQCILTPCKLLTKERAQTACEPDPQNGVHC